MVVGKNKRRQELMKHIADNPIKLCNQPMGQVSQSKYLGDVISESGLFDSVQCMVNKRIGTVSRAIYAIRSVLNDCAFSWWISQWF